MFDIFKSLCYLLSFACLRTVFDVSLIRAKDNRGVLSMYDVKLLK